MNQTLAIPKKKYHSFDLFKFFMAICVVAIHTHPLEHCTIEPIKHIYDSIVTMAVPLFFMMSGHLLAVKFSKTSEQKTSVLKKYLVKSIGLYLIWSAIYLPLAIWHYVKEGIPFFSGVKAYIVGLLFYGEHYNSWMLWYLLSTIYAVLLFLIFFKIKGSMKWVPVIAVPFLILGILTSCYITGYGRIFYGVFYMGMGMFFYGKKTKRWLYWILFVFGFLGNCVVNHDLFGVVLLAISALGAFGLIESVSLKDSLIYPVLRKMSTHIYFIHMWIWSLYYGIVYQTKTYGADCFFVTLLVCAVLSVGFLAFTGRRKRRKDAAAVLGAHQ